MNCRLNKFMSNKANFKSISTQSSAKFQKIITHIQQYPKENLKFLEFVSKVKSPKISAETYHDSAQQAIVSKPILFLRSAEASGAVSSNLFMNRVKLTQYGTPSLMNFSTNSIVKRGVGKSISKHSTGSRITSVSSSKSSFIDKSNSFLKKFMSLNAQKLYENTEAKKEDYEAEPLSLAFNIRTRLDDISTRIRDDLMKIDVSLKQRLNSTKPRVSRGKAQTDQEEKPNHSSGNATEDTNSRNIDLINLPERPYLDSHSYEHGRKRSVLGRSTKLSRLVRIRRDMINVDQPAEDWTFNPRFTEPFQVKGYLMDVPSKQLIGEKLPEPIRSFDREKHILEVTTKVAADGDGVYFVGSNPRRV